jgi:hypothetical protein
MSATYCDAKLQEAWDKLVDRFKNEDLTTAGKTQLAIILEYWDRLPEDDPIKGPLAVLIGANAAAVEMIKEHNLGPWGEEESN